MRVDLVVPFKEKDKAKALGARWDKGRMVWYVQDSTDLSQFERWLPGIAEFNRKGREAGQLSESRIPVQPTNSASNVQAGVSDCGCDALPWEHCEHTLSN
jgi:hypothetical protein